ncbi:DKNYY domain-containing protein [Burkholderia sp. F1]|uniref:DKNYY domain-containing protein n=1 Tax=Burkholderia sp. F1 TaxID=3366817 RepID=UPI003D757D83
MAGRIFRQIGIGMACVAVVAGGASRAHAYTLRACDERWYAPTQEHAFDGTREAFTETERKAKIGACGVHHAKVLRWYAHDREAFATIDGKGYFIRRSSSGSGPSCQPTHAGPVIDLRCGLPDALRPHTQRDTVEYYRLTDGELRLIDLEPDANAGSPIYATDGKWVYYLNSSSVSPVVRIAGADAATFRRFTPEGAESVAESDVWARDKNNVYYYGDRVDGMSPDAPVTMFGNGRWTRAFAINQGKVFLADYREIRLLPGMEPTLRYVSPYFISDGKAIYTRFGKRIDGLAADGFEVVMPGCPVPGHPKLNCVAYVDKPGVHMPISGGIGVQDGAIAFPDDYSTRIYLRSGLRADRVTYFFTPDERFDSWVALMIFDGRLYSLSGLKDDGRDADEQTKRRFADGVALRGALRSVGEHSIADDEGMIDVRTLKRSPLNTSSQ